MEAIILAGGQGTRLKPVISDLPKPMASIGEKPFLSHLFEYLAFYKFDRLIVSTGFKHETIEQYFGDFYKGIRIEYSRETTPLGTGGAIKLALEKVKTDNIFIFNGDTFFAIDIAKMLTQHLKSNSDITVALKPMEKFSRYGNVISNNGRIINFEEKKYCEQGTINAGIYIMKSKLFNAMDLPDMFSFETGFMEKNIKTLFCNAFISDNYFIDIGIPEDYYKADRELKDIVSLVLSGRS